MNGQKQRKKNRRESMYKRKGTKRERTKKKVERAEWETSNSKFTGCLKEHGNNAGVSF